MRASVSGSPVASAWRWLSCGEVVEQRAALVRGRCRADRSDRARGWRRRGGRRLGASTGRKPLPQSREKIGWPGFLPVPCEIIATNVGRFSFMLPRP